MCCQCRRKDMPRRERQLSALYGWHQEVFHLALQPTLLQGVPHKLCCQRAAPNIVLFVNLLLKRVQNDPEESEICF